MDDDVADHNVFLIVLNQYLVIDIFFAELVFDHSNFFAMLLSENVLKQGSFAATQKARENRYWNYCHRESIQNLVVNHSPLEESLYLTEFLKLYQPLLEDVLCHMPEQDVGNLRTYKFGC